MSVVWAVNAIIGLVLAELLCLFVWRRRWFAASVATLLAGLGLLLALRLALAQAGAAAILGCLVLAGAAHAVDLWRRRDP